MRKILFNVLFLSLLINVASCQNNKSDQTTTPSSFPGGELKLEEYIKENMNWRQGQMTVAGKVFVSFKIDEDGSISDIKVIRGLCESCDKEALRLVEEMPKWNPAKKDGKSVPSEKTITVEFKL